MSRDGRWCLGVEQGGRIATAGLARRRAGRAEQVDDGGGEDAGEGGECQGKDHMRPSYGWCLQPNVREPTLFRAPADQALSGHQT